MIIPGIIAAFRKSECDPYWDDVVLAMHFDGNLVDEKGHTVTASVANYGSGNTGFGQALQGTTGAGPISTSSDFNLSGVDNTIEAFVYCAGPDLAIVRSSGNGVYFYVDGSRYLRASTSTSGFMVSANPIPLNTWVHVAVTVSSGTIRMFINGVKEATEYTSFSWIGNNTIQFGNPQSGTNNYLDDLRITKGVARYTENFTPPTAPFYGVQC